MRQHRPREEIVSELNRAAVGLWLFAIPAVALTLRWPDLIDGSAAIPSVAYALFGLALALDAWEFLSSATYFRVPGDELRIGPRVRIARDEIVDAGVTQNWLGIRRIFIDRTDGRRWVQNAYFFARPPEEIVVRIRDWVSVKAITA